MSRRRPISERRAALGAAAVYSVAEAAELIPGSVDTTKAWLRQHGLVVAGPSGAEVVVWGDVVELLRTSRDGALSSTVRPGGMAVRLAP